MTVRLTQRTKDNEQQHVPEQVVARHVRPVAGEEPPQLACRNIQTIILQPQRDGGPHCHQQGSASKYQRGIRQVHDIRFVEDNWESPTLGAWGLGWEVWLNGMEITQFTYFQQVGGLECRPVSGEITYGIERLAMYMQGVDSIYDLLWASGPQGDISYGDIYHQNEVEQSIYNFELAGIKELFGWFDVCEAQGQDLINNKLALPAYEQVMKASHAFNLLDARHAISVTERQRYILRLRTLSREVAQVYFESREALGFPLLSGVESGE